MIPKVIHYCWFGGKEKPKSVWRCIDSWRNYCPDYEIKEWNEQNFDVNMIPYTRDAYQAGKYAFVSDVARFWVLYHEGGVYFDTDVEVIRPIDDLIERGPFMGWERAGKNLTVNPGLGLAAPKGFPLYQEILDAYAKLDYYLESGERNPYSMISLINDLLIQKGLQMDGTKQIISLTSHSSSLISLTIYPVDYLCPMDSLTGKIVKTENTYTIHHYSMSWLPKQTQWRVKMMRKIRKWLNLFVF